MCRFGMPLCLLLSLADMKEWKPGGGRTALSIAESGRRFTWSSGQVFERSNPSFFGGFTGRCRPYRSTFSILCEEKSDFVKTEERGGTVG